MDHAYAYKDVNASHSDDHDCYCAKNNPYATKEHNYCVEEGSDNEDHAHQDRQNKRKCEDDSKISDKIQKTDIKTINTTILKMALGALYNMAEIWTAFLHTPCLLTTRVMLHIMWQEMETVFFDV